MDRDAALWDWISPSSITTTPEGLQFIVQMSCETEHTIVELVDTLEFFSSKM